MIFVIPIVVVVVVVTVFVIGGVVAVIGVLVAVTFSAALNQKFPIAASFPKTKENESKPRQKKNPKEMIGPWYFAHINRPARQRFIDFSIFLESTICSSAFIKICLLFDN